MTDTSTNTTFTSGTVQLYQLHPVRLTNPKTTVSHMVDEPLWARWASLANVGQIIEGPIVSRCGRYRVGRARVIVLDALRDCEWCRVAKGPP